MFFFQWIVAGKCVPGQQDNVESAGYQHRGNGGWPVVRHVGRGAIVRGVRQPSGQAPGSDCQGAYVLASACGQCPAAGVAASAQLRLVDGRGAADRVGGRPTKRGYRAVLRGSSGHRSRFRAAETGRRGRGRRRVRRLVRARVQRPVLRRLRGGRACAVHTKRRLLLAGRILGCRARQGHQWTPVGHCVCLIRRDGGHLRSADRAQEPRLARRRVPLPVRHSSQPTKM